MWFYISFWCHYMNNSKGKLFKHKCYNLVEIVGKKLNFLERKIIKFHCLGFLCTHKFFSFSNLWGKFKFNPKPNGRIEMCFLLLEYFKYKTKKGCDNLSFYKQHLEGNHQQLWKNWIDWKKEKLEMKRHPIKKGSTQPMAIFLYFLIVMLLVTKMVFNKCFWKGYCVVDC